MPHLARRRARGGRGAFGLAVLLLASSVGPVAASGKPGYPDAIAWAGVTWSIKTSRSAVGPGPCVFAKTNASVDTTGLLHLTIAKSGSTWTCAEIIGPTSYGYGTYTFTLASSVGALDPNVVLGLFTWSDRAPYAHREIDIEVARWGSPTDPTNAQYVVQPYATARHLQRFTQPSVTTSTQSFTWRADQVSWQSLDGSGTQIASYAYSGSDVPRPGDERVHLNLWLFNGAAPTNGQAVDVVVRSFSFTP